MKRILFKDRDGQTPLPPELYKGLKLRHVQTVGELDECEEQNIAEGLVWLARQSHPGVTYEFWLKLHKRLFGEVWDWAGKVRTHELQNPDFLAPFQIWPALKQLEGDLAFWVKEKTYSLRENAARFHERLATIHPFANGNGRFARILVEYWCKQVGEEVPTWGAKWADVPAERRKLYIAALETARRTHSYAKLIEFMYS